MHKCSEYDNKMMHENNWPHGSWFDLEVKLLQNFIQTLELLAPTLHEQAPVVYVFPHLVILVHVLCVLEYPELNLLYFHSSALIILTSYAYDSFSWFRKSSMSSALIYPFFSMSRRL